VYVYECVFVIECVYVYVYVYECVDVYECVCEFGEREKEIIEKVIDENV